MERYEYKVVPAPRNGIRVKGVKGPAAKFAAALEASMNLLAIEGWEYIRAETLPADERQGLTRRKTETTQHVLIFRRIASTEKLSERMDPPLGDLTDDTEEAENIFSGNDDEFPEEDANETEESVEDKKP
ncbi:DUF4177 domain-containing protein [Amylibacter sp. SFDW26]|uniref:DUF4177 domain-containing protein n=1 Tax=Amylibacter sp. SFDW26 TaxID=2652722 RepID=UPI001262266D|nr:DUF4177 domain-containing protein [Amylibacter sp. SFDW26]KAB7610319.1 DUF4177 domain-containing protein [Amylibacter sp. SFDW26]